MGGVQARMESVLARLLPRRSVAPARLHEAMRYATLEGGKRVRPLLAFAAGEVAGAAPERLEIAAAAVELIHAYSLVHDDLPCMDDDVLRRGKPTVHVEYDEATALLVGDALQSLAFQLLAEHRARRRSARQLEMVKMLAVAAGSRGMAGGQQIDLEATGKALSAARARVHAHPQDRRADPRRGAAGRCSAENSRRRKSRSWTDTPRPSASPSRWSTTCSTPRRARRRWARPPARTRSRASRPTFRRWACRGRASWPRSCAPRRTRRSPASARPARRLARARRLHRSAKILDGDDHGRAARRRLQSR